MKKVLAFVLAAVMVLSFAACGGNGGEKVLKMGGIGPLTGDYANYGTSVRNGAQIAVDEINAKDGAVKIEFSAQDDAADPGTSINAYNELRDWGMQVLIGTVTTTPCIAVADKTAEDGMFQLTPSASSTQVIDNDNVFQVCFTDPNQGIASADYMAENMADAAIAVIYSLIVSVFILEVIFI